MSPATEAQRAQMAHDVAEVEAQLWRGAKRAGLNLLVNADTLLLLTTPLSALVGVTTDSTRRVVEGLEAERQTLATWRTRWRAWAEAGQREDGSGYSFERWQAVGRSISSSITYWTGEAAGRTAFVAVEQAASDTKKTVEAVAEAVKPYLPELPTPEDFRDFRRKAARVGLALLVIAGLGAAGYAVRSVR